MCKGKQNQEKKSLKTISKSNVFIMSVLLTTAHSLWSNQHVLSKQWHYTKWSEINDAFPKKDKYILKVANYYWRMACCHWIDDL